MGRLRAVPPAGLPQSADCPSRSPSFRCRVRQWPRTPRRLILILPSPCYAALRPNPRRCRVPRSVRPDARKTPLHRHRPGLSQAWRSRRLCDRRPRSLGRRARTQLHVRSRTTAILARRAFDDAPTRPLKGVTDAPLGRRPANRTLTRRQVRRYRAARRWGLDAVAVRLARPDAVRAADRLYMGDATTPVEAHEHGMATIWDADVLIWAASQTVDARDRGLRTSRLMGATPHDILAFIRSREGRPINDSPPRTLDGLPARRSSSITQGDAAISEEHVSHHVPGMSSASVKARVTDKAFAPQA